MFWDCAIKTPFKQRVSLTAHLGNQANTYRLSREESNRLPALSLSSQDYTASWEEAPVKPFHPGSFPAASLISAPSPACAKPIGCLLLLFFFFFECVRDERCSGTRGGVMSLRLVKGQQVGGSCLERRWRCPDRCCGADAGLPASMICGILGRFP